VLERGGLDRGDVSLGGANAAGTCVRILVRKNAHARLLRHLAPQSTAPAPPERAFEMTVDLPGPVIMHCAPTCRELAGCFLLDLMKK